VVFAAAAAVVSGLVSPVAHAGPPAGVGVRPVVEAVALSSARVVEPGVRELRDKRFAMVALRWTDRTGSAPAGVRIQAQREDGRWSRWFDVAEQDGSDAGRVTGSEPLWVGDSSAVRVRSAETAGLSVVLIDPGTSTTDVSAASVSQPAVISRAGWGADETIRTDCYAQQGVGVEYATTVKAATIHHTAETNDYTAADSARIVRGIYAYHAITNGWCDIGYNVLVDKYGQIFEGRFGGLHRPVWGAHAGGFNQYTFGVSMLGTFTDVAPTAELIEAVSSIVAWKLAGSYRDPNGQVTLISSGGGTSKYPAGAAVTLPTIFGHRDVGNTECPGDIGYQQLPAIRQRVTTLMGDWRSSAIYAKWQSTGADAGSLGGVYELETDAANGGRWASFNGPNRTVYWSAASGAHIVKGAILATWDSYARERGILGYPTTDELSSTDGVGRYNHFAGVNGSIYWTPSTGAHEIHGGIKSKWVSLGSELGFLRYPVTDELGTPDGIGRYNHFSSGGSIYWHPYWGAHEVHGAIRSRWASLGWERSYLGYPISDEYSIPGGRRSDFENGYITWNAATGVVTDRRY
jgi:uncharacterized protein with LGFP repeats